MDVSHLYDPDALQQLHRHLNENTPFDRIALRAGLELAIDPASRFAYQWFCVDPTATREFDHFLRVSGQRRRLLDIGAFYGIFSMAFTARAGTEALAVEPSPQALAVLRANGLLNPRNAMRVFDGAAGASDALVRMRHDGAHLIGADLVPDGGEASLVKVMAGDDLLADQRFVPDIIKIDVEGYEQQVLTGLSRTLDFFRPDLHVEVHGPWLPMFDSSTDSLFRLLRQHGYRIRLIDGQEISEMDADRLRAEMFHVFCTHRSTQWADRVRGVG